MKKHKRIPLVLGAACALVVGLTNAPFAAAATNPLQPGAQLYVDPASTTAQAAATLTGQDQANALLLAMYPTATWFDGGTPAEVQSEAATLVADANAAGQVPVIVAYNLPNRDCGQYSAGGAQSLADYEQWIIGLAAGIGNGPAVVILEPDGLGLIPNYMEPGQANNCTIAGASSADRFTALNFAVTTLKGGPNTSVYLDATHPGWQNVGAAAQRLILGGVLNADGFFLNASNYNWTQNNVDYGDWISGCIALAVANSPADPGAWDAPDNCRNQYWNGGPATSWQGTGMDPLQQWSNQPFADPNNPTADEIASLTWNTVGIDSQYASDLASANTSASVHFVVDTSRNGTGPWDTSTSGLSGDPENWCNPPGAGIGPAPEVDPLASDPLVDAYLWIKVPGESDGQCRGSATGNDPEWGVPSPAAGAWFPQQAAQLIAYASPALTLTVPTTTVTYAANLPAGVAAQPTGMPNPATITGVLVNSTITAAAAPSLAGYTFAGWCTVSGTTCDPANLGQAGAAFTVTGTATLYAIWTQNAPANNPPVNNNGLPGGATDVLS